MTTYGRCLSARNRGAFTLVELLVVIAIIGMLAALLMPAINSARESARQAQCTNNQQQFGKAILQYVTTKDYFPGYRELLQLQNGVTPPPYAVISWQVALMPNLGKTDVYQALQTGAIGTTANPMPYWSDTICPSDFSGTGKTSPWTSYVVNTGGLDLDSSHSFQSNNMNYYDKPANGVFLDRARLFNNSLNTKPKLSLTDIKDGQQTTLLLSENVDAYYYIDQPVALPAMTLNNPPTPTQVDTAMISPNGSCTERGTGFVWWDTSSPGVATLPNIPSPPATTGPDPSYPWSGINVQRDGTWDPTTAPWATDSNNFGPYKSNDPMNHAARPASNHPGGVIVTFVGGNSRFLREDIDYPVFCLLMTSDGANACVNKATNQPWELFSLFNTNPTAATTNSRDNTNHSWQKYKALDEGSL